MARTELGRDERVVLAGHIDTVPLTDPPNLPTQRIGDELVGRGTVDMKGGVAVQLKLAQQVREPSRDVTYVFYEGEEIDGEYNGLAHLVRDRPEILHADFAVLLEPTNGAVEGGCKGTLRAEILTKGVAAHSARPWNGHNAIHDAEAVLHRLDRVRGANRHGRRPRLPRGPPGRRHPGRHRRQRHPGPVCRHGQLPVCAGQVGPRGRGPRA